HYRSSIEPDANLSELWKDAFLYHWKEESQHAIMDEVEWRREDAKMTGSERDRAVDDLIALVAAIDGMLHVQAKADAEYFIRAAGRPYEASEHAAIDEMMLKAYRYQYIVSGVSEPRFMEVLKSMVTKQQLDRIVIALTPILEHVAS